MNSIQSAEKGNFPAAVETLTLDPYTMQQETMMLGMRLTREGVSDQEFLDRFGKRIMDVFPKELERILARKLVQNGVLSLMDRTWCSRGVGYCLAIRFFRNLCNCLYPRSRVCLFLTNFLRNYPG